MAAKLRCVQCHNMRTSNGYEQLRRTPDTVVRSQNGTVVQTKMDWLNRKAVAPTQACTQEQ